MKNIFLSLLMILVSGIVFSQEFKEETTDKKDVETDEIQTLLTSGFIKSHGGYGAIMIGYTSINSNAALHMGVRGAWIINHNVGIGMAGYGFVNEPKTMDVSEEDKNNLGLDEDNKYGINGGYGGFLIEPIIWAKKPIHLSFPIIIGAGGAAYTQMNNHNYNDWDNDWDDNWDEDWNDKGNEYVLDRDAFFVFEPGIEVELNMTKFFRISVGGSYRYTTDVTFTTMGQDDKDVSLSKPGAMRGLSFGISLKFGKF